MLQQQHSSALLEENWRRSSAWSPMTPQLISTRASMFAAATVWDHPGNITTSIFRLKNTPPLGMLRGTGYFVLKETPHHQPFIWHPMIPMFSRNSSRSSSQTPGYFPSRGVRTSTFKILRALLPTFRTDLMNYLKRTGCDSLRVWSLTLHCFLACGPGVMTSSLVQ